MYKKSSVIITILIIILLLQVSVYGEEIDIPQIGAQSAILIDADTGQILYAKNEHAKMFPASITKVMTALLALEKGGLDTVFTADSKTIAIESGSAHASVQAGERLTVEQLLYFTMIVSGNDSANGLGQYVSGDLKVFTDLMTKRAAELGCRNTFFWNTNGLNDAVPSKDKHMTTAYDMALIMKRACEFPKFLEIISTQYYETPPTNKFNHTRKYSNSNQLINKKSGYYYEYCVGGKTGWTTPAGNTLVTYAEKDGTRLICVILKANGKQVSYNDTKTLFNYGFNRNNFKILTFGDKEAEVFVRTKEVAVKEDGKVVGEVIVSIDPRSKLIIPKGFELDSLKIEIVCPDTINKGEDADAEAIVTFPENMYTYFKQGEDGGKKDNGGFSSEIIKLNMIMDKIKYFPVENTPHPGSSPQNNITDSETENPDGNSNNNTLVTILSVFFIAAALIVLVVLRLRQIRRIKRIRKIKQTRQVKGKKRYINDIYGEIIYENKKA